MAEFIHSLGFEIPSENTVNPTHKYKGGFPAGYQLPAPHFNWIVDKTSKAIDELQKKKFDLGGVYSGDMNDLVLAGQYRLHNNTNLPTNSSYGQAFVGRGAIGTDTVVQIVVSYSGHKMYYRGGRLQNETWIWEEWSEIYSTKNNPYAQNLNGVLPISKGGTEATNRKNAFSNLACLGTAPINTVANDTPKNWADIGTGYAWYNPADKIIDKPSDYAILINLVYGADLTQFWIVQPLGRMYKRSGSIQSGWNSTWFKAYDERNKPTPAEIGAVPIGYGFAESAKFISNTSLVDVLSTGKSGFYKGTNVTGAPTTNEWWLFEVICHDENYSTVMAYQEAGTDIYHMFYRGGVLGNWYKVHTSAEAIPIENGGTGATNAPKALQNLGITATAAELNYVDGVTSNVQTQLNGKSPTTHGHALTDSNITGILPIPKGGTGATDVPNARKNLNFISGTYYGTGNSGGGNMYNFDTGARGSNVIMIHGINARGFLCPWGGFMVYDNGAGVLSPTEIQAFGQNSGEYASYSDGYISLKTSHDYINVQGGVFQYWCL